MTGQVQQLLQALGSSGCGSAGLWADKAGWILFLSGIVGGLFRAWASRHPTLSKRMVLDILIGGVAPVVLSVFKLVPLEGVSFLQLAIFGGAVGLFGSYFLAWAMYKLGVFKSDVRAEAPGGPEPLLNGENRPPHA